MSEQTPTTDLIDRWRAARREEAAANRHHQAAYERQSQARTARMESERKLYERIAGTRQEDSDEGIIYEGNIYLAERGHVRCIGITTPELLGDAQPPPPPRTIGWALTAAGLDDETRGGLNDTLRAALSGFADWELDSECGMIARAHLDMARPLIEAIDPAALPKLWAAIVTDLAVICHG